MLFCICTAFKTVSQFALAAQLGSLRLASLSRSGFACPLVTDAMQVLTLLLITFVCSDSGT